MVTYNIDKFDLEQWMMANNIPVFHRGANVGKGWIGTNCPFCPDGDNGGHLGINKTSKLFSCWRCKTKGGVIKLIKKLRPNANIQKILGAHITKGEIINYSDKKTFADKCNLPRKSTEKILKPQGKYLKSRNFNPREIFAEYKLRSIGKDAKWGHRIIIPIYRHQKLVSFVGRDITNKAKIRYKACPLELSVLDPKSLVYNIDSAKERLILVEGATDVWRIGRGCGAMMGVGQSPEQVKDIVARNFKHIYLLFDNDVPGQKEAETLASTLALYTNVENITLPENIPDPGELPNEDVLELRRYVFGTAY